MSGTKQPRSPKPSDVSTCMVNFRVLDLRARRQTTNLEHMRPYCVLRLGDQHHRTASFPPEGLGQVPARRTTADDRQHPAPEAEDVSSSGVCWEIPMSWTKLPCGGDTCQSSLGFGCSRQGKSQQKQEDACRGDNCAEVILEIHNQTDLDSSMSIDGFDTEMVGVLRVKLSDMFADHGVSTRGHRTQVSHGYTSVTKPGDISLDHPGVLSTAETCARLTRYLRHRRDRWFGGVVSPPFCSRHDPRRASAASGVIVEARLEISWDGCGTERSPWPVHDSFGQALDPRNTRKCLSAQNLWTELREPLQRARWNSEAGQSAWATVRARCSSTEPTRMPMENADGRQDWENEVRELVWNGVPAEMREEVYMSLSGGSSKRKLFGNKHYEALVGKCRRLEDDIDGSDMTRKRDDERASSPPVGAGRPKSLRPREEAMPPEMSCVEPTRSVEPAHPVLHSKPFYRAIVTNVSHGFPGDKTQSDQSIECLSSSDSVADQLSESSSCPYLSASTVNNTTEGTELATATPHSTYVDVADVSSGSGAAHSMQDSEVGDAQEDSSSADGKPQTLQSERLHQECRGTAADIAQAARDSTKRHAHKVWREIEADLDRVFMNGKTRVNSAAGMASMRRVLRAYSLHNLAVGYCQGMNFVAGFLLEVVSEETAFWLLAAFCEDLKPGYHTKSMMGARSDIAALKEVIQHELPRFHTRASEVHMPLELKLTQWLLVGFVNCFPPHTALRILEVSFLEGSEVYLATALGFLRLHEEEVLQGEDIADVVCTLDRAQSSMYEADILLTQVWRELAVVGDTIRSSREWHRDHFKGQEGQASAQNRERAWHAADEAPDDRGGYLHRRSSTGSGSTWPKSLPGQVGALVSTLNRKARIATLGVFVDGKLARPALMPLVVGGFRWLLGWKAFEP